MFGMTEIHITEVTREDGGESNFIAYKVKEPSNAL
jgi:hypothetical protein